MGMKLTHVNLDTIGDHTAQGWWYENGKPKLRKYVVVTAKYAYPRGMWEMIDFFHKLGAKQVQIIPEFVYSGP